MSPTVPQFYDPSNYTFLTDHEVQFCKPETASTTGSSGTASSLVTRGSHQFDPSVVGNGAGFQFVVSPEISNGEMVSSAWMYTLSEPLGNVSSDLDVEAFSNCGTGQYDIARDQSFGDDGFQPDHMSHYAVNLTPALVAYSWSPCTGENFNWGLERSKYEMATVEDSHKKVSKYSEEERKEKIYRYLKKRSRRNFNKTIKYACRKTLADRRVRVRGRFAKNNASYDPVAELAMENTHNPHENLYFVDQANKLQDEEDDLLRAAMANLVYLCQPFPHYM